MTDLTPQAVFAIPGDKDQRTGGYLYNARVLAELNAAVADVPYAQGILWRARRDDQDMLIVGTMHIHDPRLEAIREQIRDEVENADLILLEATAESEQQLQNLFWPCCTCFGQGRYK